MLPPPDTDAPAGATVGAQSPHALWQFAKAVRAELSDPLTPIMAVGSAATAILGSPIDAVMVGFVLIGNAMLAAGQQMRAENRLNVLLAQQTPLARKVTDETYTEVMAEQLQPGDVIEVRSNEVVPADARIIEAIDLEVDESSLTGESLSVDKRTESTPGAELAERSCMLYAGTTVVAGTAVALVTAVGSDTQTRRAAELASGRPAGRRAAAPAQQADVPGLPGQRGRWGAGRRAGPVARRRRARPSVMRSRSRWRRCRRDAADGDAGAVRLGAAPDRDRRAGARPAVGGGARPHRCGLFDKTGHAQREPAAGDPGAPGGRTHRRRRAALRDARRAGARGHRTRPRHRPGHHRSGGEGGRRNVATPTGRASAVPVRPGVLGVGDWRGADDQGRTGSGAGRLRRCRRRRRHRARVGGSRSAGHRGGPPRP
ncbi:putative cation-transporting ATPase I [Mycobacterium talmoniae]|uniref:Putative cation-transporting ATPase I n=1 Tax=Mycobacterium talmoniae TaxID=1858794 RepID=A0A2S8BD64_9MYCO|nr:putative cation-transporting ATPase I [Mycobacterium talmoniae]